MKPRINLEQLTADLKEVQTEALSRYKTKGVTKAKNRRKLDFLEFDAQEWIGEILESKKDLEGYRKKIDDYIGYWHIIYSSVGGLNKSKSPEDYQKAICHPDEQHHVWIKY